MKVGDRVAVKTSNDMVERGTVVYIHPEERYYTAEFKGLFGSFRESFFFPLMPINEQIPNGKHYKSSNY